MMRHEVRFPPEILLHQFFCSSWAFPVTFFNLLHFFVRFFAFFWIFAFFSFSCFGVFPAFFQFFKIFEALPALLNDYLDRSNTGTLQ